MSTPPTRRNSLTWILLLTTLAGCGEGPAPESSEPAAVVVELIEVEPRHWTETLELTAEVVPWAAVTVAAEIAGRIVELPVDEGDTVTRGQLVAHLDPADSEAQLAQARARLQSAAANLAQARRDLERGRNLAEGDGLISEDGLDRLELALETARAAEAEAEAGLAVARERLADTALRAPFAGVVGLRTAEVGSWVAPGSPVLRVVDAERVKVRASASQSDRVRLEIGTAVSVRAHALPDVLFSGRIRALGQESDPSTGSYTVEAETPAVSAAGGERLLPGMHAVMLVEIGQREAIVVPQKAILARDGASIAFVVREGRAELRTVEVETLATGEVAASAGLSPGDRLVVRGQHALEDGTPVSLDTP